MKCPHCEKELEYVDVSLDDGSRMFEDCWIQVSYKEGKFSFSYAKEEYEAYYQIFNMPLQYEMIEGEINRDTCEGMCPECDGEVKINKDGTLDKAEYE